MKRTDVSHVLIVNKQDQVQAPIKANGNLGVKAKNNPHFMLIR